MSQKEYTPEEIERVKKAQEAIQAICQEYQVILDPLMTFSVKGYQIQVDIVPRPEQSRILKPQLRMPIPKTKHQG